MTDLRKAAEDLLEVVEAAIRAGDWKVDGACDPDSAIVRLRQALNVDAVNISQERVDETVKGEHEWVAMDDRQRLEAIVKVVQQYLPPDGISIKEAMSKIIELVDPLPPKREWVGLTDEDFYGQSEIQVMAMKYAEAKLKEKNT